MEEQLELYLDNPYCCGARWPMAMYICQECARPTIHLDDICCSGLMREKVYVAPVTIKDKEPDPDDVSLDALNLHIRVYNCLSRAGLRTVNEVCSKDPRYIVNLPNFGKMCQDDLKAELFLIGRKLGDLYESKRI